ncbi:MAG TPA: alpha-amylase family glycosyl hydrolase [Azospirillaceae bacterium]|nr:alpha-amylase family glycosyl hydrolase [Azospirillaceae bacterium]
MAAVLAAGATFPLSAHAQGAQALPSAGTQVAQAAQKPTRPWAEDVLYFLLLDRFADGSDKNNMDVNRDEPGTFHGGDIAGLTRKLDELKDLGITAIWINPIMLNIPGYVSGNFPHWAHHGYWADDFSKMDPRFGTEDELKTLVDEAHKRGIRILLDVVYNHAGYGSAYTKRPDARKLLRSEDFGTCGPEGDDITSCLAGLPDFKTEDPEVAKMLIESQIPRAKKAGVDGYRLDTVKHVLPEFWNTHRKMTRDAMGKDFFLLGEIFGADYQVADPYFEADQMDGALDFAFQGETLAFVQGRGRTAAYSRFLQKRHKVRPGFVMSHYLSSHDVPGALFQLGGDIPRFRLMAALQMASIGMPQIYYGEEVGRAGGDWPENRSDMPWTDGTKPGSKEKANTELRDYYKRLIAARKANPAFAHGDYKELAKEGDLLVFSRSHAESGNAVVVAVNRSEQPQQGTVALPEAWNGKTVKDAITGKSLGTGSAAFALSVPALTAQYLTVQ